MTTANLSFKLFENDYDERLRWYSLGGVEPIGEDYNCLGFQDRLPVVSDHFEASPVRGHLRTIRKLAPAPDFSNMELDGIGNKFINLNGQRLKVVPQGQIPEEVRKYTLLMKQHTVHKPRVLKGPLRVRVIGGDTSQVNKAPAVRLVDKPLSGDKLVVTGKCDKLPGLKKFKLIRSRVKGTIVASKSSTVRVNPTPQQPVSLPRPVSVTSNPTISCERVPFGSEKLLSAQTLKVLNQVKMQALNLSMNKQRTLLRDMATQTSEVKHEDQLVQTDCTMNKFQLLELDLDSLLEMPLGESPLLADVNMGVCPMGVGVNKMEDVGELGRSVFSSVPVFIGPKISREQMIENNSVEMKKKMLFFADLRECLNYNPDGNLPIHEGVISNDIGLVKRHCAALKARNAGVNIENHNGCTPLQLAIIHNADVDVVETLINAGGDLREEDGDGNNILHLSAKFARLSALEGILYNRVFRMAFTDCLNRFNFEGLTPLMICCIANWTEGAGLLIRQRADVNVRDQTSGRTALFHAAEAQNAEIVRILLNHGADPKIKNFFGTSPHDAMYELDEMPELIKNLIFGKSKKRTIEAEMNPARTAKAAKSLKTFSRLQRVDASECAVTKLPPGYTKPEIK